VTELIGDTPLVCLDSFADNLLGKVEAANPYSVKDRIALYMIEAAAESGDLPDDGTVVEATSGNTGIGLAAVCAARGYDCVLTMPESMSEERRQLLSGLGADLELTPADGGMSGAIERANELADAPDTVRARQFENEANPRAHRETTGPEIWSDTAGDVDAVVAGVGTGGTITGISEYIEEEVGADLTSVAVEPEQSKLLSAADPDSHDIQGIGPGFVPDILRRDLVDEVRTASKQASVDATHRLASEAGLMVGISSGAALHAAAEYATENPDETVVVVLPDTGERYLSTDLWK
jgi:cysteine synthase A